MISALLFPLRLLIAPIDRLLAAHIRDLAARALAEQALADAALAPDFVEPPAEPEPDAEVLEPEPIYQELVTEIVLDAANERAWEHGPADLEAWEDERIAGLVERWQR